MKALFTGIMLAAGLAAQPALARNNCAEFDILGQQGTDNYSPFEAANFARNFTLKVRRLDPAVTSVRFLLVDATPTANGPRIGDAGPADYDIAWITDTGREVFVSGAQSVTDANGATVSFGNGNADVSTTQFQLRVPRGQEASAGRQQENLIIRYQCFSGRDRSGTENEQLSGETRLVLRVPRYVAAYIGGTGQTHGEIAFGRLDANSSNLRQSVSVTALSTVPFDVSIDTDHDGMLKRDKKDERGIAYEMRYAGLEVDPGSTVTCPVTPAPLGKIEELEVALDGSSIGSLPAGDYTDIITLTFEPRDGAAVTGCTKRRG